MSKWISVEEQWPRHGCDVLVAYKAGKYVLLGVGEFDGTAVNADGLTVPYFKGVRGFEVTHWMSLPELPEKNLSPRFPGADCTERQSGHESL